MELLNNCVFSDQEEEGAVVTRELHVDLISEILTWIPSDSLRFSCKWVCKDWHSLITNDQSFKELRQLRTPTTNGFFFQTTRLSAHHNIFIPHSPSSTVNPSPTLDFLPCNRRLNILDCSKSGLLCCVSAKNTTYYMCKPCTKQWHQIPSPTTRFKTVKMALMHVSTIPYLRYKLVRFSRSQEMLRLDRLENHSSYHCEIFDSNNDEWKRLEDVRLPFFAVLRWGPSVLINGIFHWLLFHKDREDKILAFHICEERWGLVEVPQEIIERRNNNSRKNLVDFNGKLGLIYYIRGELLDIWVLEDYKKEKWENKCRVSFEDHQEISRLKESFPLNLYKDGILLMKSFNEDEVIWFDYQRNSCEAVKIPATNGLLLKSFQAFPFESDFVPISTWDHKIKTRE